MSTPDWRMKRPRELAEETVAAWEQLHGIKLEGWPRQDLVETIADVRQAERNYQSYQGGPKR